MVLSRRKGKEMSAYTEQQTQINDADILKKCLEEKGYKEVEQHATAQQLVGYHGDARKDTAEIIIRRKHIGSASNDIGFKKQSDGTYAAVISDFDKGKHNAAWMADLKKKYADKKIRAQASKAGLTFLKKIDGKDGSYKLQFVQA
jgi:hypothetical protein